MNTIRHLRRAAHHLGRCAAIALMLGAVACSSTPKAPIVDVPMDVNASKPLPDAADVVARYNARVADLSRLRSQVTLIVDQPDPDGSGRTRDQVEGSLQIMLPSSVALRIDKVGQALSFLGSNTENYWWLDLTDNKIGYVGTHAQVTQDKVRRFAVPVHPLDLLEVAAVTPLPSPNLLFLAWTKDGRLVVRVPGRWTTRRLFMDASTLEPSRIELIDRQGRLALGAELSRYQRVPVDANAFSTARIAGQIDLVIPAADATALLALVEPQNPGDKLRLKAFDLPALLDSYNVKDVRDLDARP
jgi:hypothetical protein